MAFALFAPSTRPVPGHVVSALAGNPTDVVAPHDLRSEEGGGA